VIKPLIERLSRGAQSQTGEVDPAVVAASFGAVYPPASPLPETPIPQRHASDDGVIRLDERAPKPKPKPTLVSLAMTRLQSLTPLSAEKKKQVETAIAEIFAPLTAIDALVKELEEERWIAISTRWESIREQGRELLDSLPELQRKLAVARGYCNQSGEAKGRAKNDVENFFEQRRHMSRFATDGEVRAADRKLEQGKDAMRRAEQKALDDLRAMAKVESKIASVKANLEAYQIELQRLETELRNEQYFDPETGLCRNPTYYRDNW
jgi:hypothetical protein